MKLRSTLILLVVGVALFSYVYFVENKRKSTRESTEASGRVAQIDRDKYNTVAIQNPDSKLELKKSEGNEWRLEFKGQGDEVIKDRADSTAVAQLFTSLETLRHDAKIDPENKDQLKEYGVSDSNTKVRLSGEGQKTVEVLLGKDAAVEGKVYARVDGSDTVYVIGNDLKTQLNKKPDDFRDRKLADITTQQINRVTVKTKDGEVELEKKNNHWSITKPLKARGDDSKINDLIASATSARIDQFITDSSNLANYGLTEPRATVDFYSEGTDKPVTLQIGGNGKEEKDKTKTYAKLSTRDTVVLVPKEIEKILESRPNDLRDRNIVRVDKDIVDRITVEAPNKPKLVFARKGESWVRKDGDKDVTINDAIPVRLLGDLQNTQVTNFVADTATELPKYGLDNPPIRVTLSSYASENTAESKAGDKPIVSVLFGKIEGDNGYAKVDDEPFIVAVPRPIIEGIPTDAIEVQPLGIYSFKPEEITTLEVTKEGQPPVSLEKDKDGKWKLAKGDGNVNQANVGSLVTVLNSLRAAKWAGPTVPQHGLDKPGAVASFTVTQGDKKAPGKVSVGGASPEGLYYATAEGLSGTFMITKPDRDAFDLALIDKPQATPPVGTPPVPAPGAPTSSPAVPAPAVPPAEAVTPPVQALPPAEPAPAPPTSAPAGEAVPTPPPPGSGPANPAQP
jgi:hypothetical protein